MAAARDVVLYDSTGVEVPIPGPKSAPPLSVVPIGVDNGPNDRARSYPSRRLTGNRIAQILENADQGDPLELIELEEEMVEKDAKLASVLSTRTNAVIGLPWECSPPKLADSDAADQDQADEIAKFCEQALSGCQNFIELVGDLLDAISKPFAVDWIDWGFDKNGKIIPSCFRRVPPRHIRWAFDSDTIRIFDPMRMTGEGGNVGVVPEPYTTVRAISNTRRDHPTRAGILRTLAWLYFFKNTSIKDWVAFLDRYGMPVRIATVADAVFSDDAMLASIRSQLKNIGSDASAVLNESTTLTMENGAKENNAAAFQTLVDYIDKCYAWVVLGHELSSQSSPGSGQLGITASLQVRQDILEADCAFVSHAIRRDVLVPLVGWNFGWDRVELTPNLYFDCEPPRDLAAEAVTLQTVLKTFPDLECSEQQIRDTFGIDSPVENNPEDALMPAKAPSPAAVGGDPNALPADDPNATDVTINSAAAKRRRLMPRRPSRYSPKRQAKVDRVADKGIAIARQTVATWGDQLRKLLAEAKRDGVELYEVRNRIIKAYPELNVEALDRTLREQSLLVTLFGRVQ